MNHIYTTDAFVLKSQTIGEANRAYVLLTRDLGLIRATAQGVRLAKSKLKGHLSLYSLISVSVVRGKEVWRITGAETVLSVSFFHTPAKLSVFKNMCTVLSRLVHGEEKNEALFAILFDTQKILSEHELSSDLLKNLETLGVLSILFELGYVKREAIPQRALSYETINAFTDKKQAIETINTALHETHL